MNKNKKRSVYCVSEADYFKDGVEIGQDNWGCCLEPHPAYLEYAETFLDERQMNAVRALWTDEVMEAFAEKQYRNRKE